MNDQERLAWVQQTLQRRFRLDPGLVQLEADLAGDLGLDSIDCMELAQELHEALGTRLRAEQFHELSTIRDVVAALRAPQEA